MVSNQLVEPLIRKSPADVGLSRKVRGTYPCLRVPTRDVKERELPGPWRGEQVANPLFFAFEGLT